MKKARRKAGGAGRPGLFDGCTDFEVCVYECVMKIPSGQTRTYAWVAEKIGKPRASRAVAQALHRNPWPLIIPCHRVVESGGRIGGYAYGVKLKKLFLSLEKKGATFYVGAGLFPKGKKDE